MTLCPDTRIEFDRAGAMGGTTILLLHAGVADRRMWEPQWAALTSRHDVVRLDLRGFGGSDSPPAKGHFAHHEDVIETLSWLGVDRVHLIGCSFGAGVAVDVALTSPHLVASLALITPGGCLIPELTPELSEFIAAEDVALDRGDLDVAVAANLDWWVDGPHRDAAQERSEVRALVAAMQRRAFELTSGWEDVEERELDPPALDRLGEVNVPTLVVTGALDLDAIALAADAVADGIAGACRAELPTAHMPTLELPAESLALLERWLADLEGA